MRRAAVVLLLFALGLVMMGGDRPPWLARRRPGLRVNQLVRARVEPADWPAEPESPRQVDPARFARALRGICGWMPAERAQRYTQWILQYAAEFEVDPFLMAALVYREGRCRSDSEGSEHGEGLGLTQIHREMYAEQLRGGTLRWRVRHDGHLVERTRRVDRFPFAGPRLLQPEPNLYFAAALLAQWRDQHETVDALFEQEPHRHYVSHFVWGDRVRSDREEDQLLMERRRVLEHYGAHAGAPPVRFHGIELGCPLDGCPRVVSSYLGSERDGGERSHRGIDLESLPGEPVRAVASGTVIFAGVDLPGQQEHVQLARAEDYEGYPRNSLGAGGRYVCLRHAREDGPDVRTCYMHLEEVHVRYGQALARGQVLGTVGRTGMRTSAAHLHLELHTDRVEDASVVMGGLLLGRRESDPGQPRRRRRR
ncbi:MAG: peptidoglycan DD-metalloendopeptidase family protein [Sandaracinaceae bacterium]|nr:peptidoglycan DD-metalloendopeptidase family protein [Sandaracinaceae bacterium]